MTPIRLGYAVLAFAALGLAPALAGPCDDDITVLKRKLGNQLGLGAPVSEPDRGQNPAPAQVAQPNAEPGATASTDRAQPGGASRTAGGSPGTVGGVAGPATSAVGPGAGGGIASGQIATSSEDVRRQSEGLPTTAVQAARGVVPPEAAAADKSSRAKMALQKAVDLNANNDAACANHITEARDLMPE
jgi:hypothetical protein